MLGLFFCPSTALHLWIADQVRNDGTMHGIVFTLTFDSSPIKGEGEDGWLDLFTRVTLPHLWIADQVRNDGTGMQYWHIKDSYGLCSVGTPL